MTAGSTSAYSAQFRSPPNTFSQFERATYFTAVRQFEQAIVAFEYALADEKWAKANPELWNRALLNMLAIVSRVKRDPNLARELISRFYDGDDYPKDLKPAADVWRLDVRMWDKERKRNFTFSEIEKLMAEGLKKEQKTKKSGLIPLLRVSASLNEILRAGTLKGERLQKAYFLADQIAEYFSDLSVASFATDYYRLCTDNNAKKQLTNKCGEAFARLTFDQS